MRLPHSNASSRVPMAIRAFRNPCAPSRRGRALQLPIVSVVIDDARTTRTLCRVLGQFVLAFLAGGAAASLDVSFVGSKLRIRQKLPSPKLADRRRPHGTHLARSRLRHRHRSRRPFAELLRRPRRRTRTVPLARLADQRHGHAPSRRHRHARREDASRYRRRPRDRRRARLGQCVDRDRRATRARLRVRSASRRRCQSVSGRPRPAAAAVRSARRHRLHQPDVRHAERRSRSAFISACWLVHVDFDGSWEVSETIGGATTWDGTLGARSSCYRAAIRSRRYSARERTQHSTNALLFSAAPISSRRTVPSNGRSSGRFAQNAAQLRREFQLRFSQRVGRVFAAAAISAEHAHFNQL